MKFQLVSDIHLEYLEDDEGVELDFGAIIEPNAPILVMAGDIATFECPILPAFLNWVSTNFDYVFWILGNHEFYNTKRASMSDVKTKLKSLCPKNVRILDNDSVVIHDVLFIGSTLWSHVPDEHVDKVYRTVSDYRYIYSDCKVDEKNLCISVQDTNRIHAQSVAFIRNTLKQNKGKYAVVITHHGPSLLDTIHSIYHRSPLNHAFATDIAFDDDDGPDIWCYGHTHYNISVDKHPNGYKLVSNQFGYEGEHDGRLFKYSYCIEVGDGLYYG